MSVVCDYNVNSTTVDFKSESSAAYSRSMDKYGVDIKAFGAVGDGVADDTEALVKAFSSGYKTIILSEGTYMVRGGIKIASNKKIVGLGENTIIKLIKNSGNTNVLTASNSSNIELKNFKIDANKEEYDDKGEYTTCIHFDKCSNLSFENVSARGGSIEGIYLYDSCNIILNNLKTTENGFYRCDASGLHIDTCRNVKVNNLVSLKNGFHGLLLSCTSNAYISDVVARNNGWDGLRIQYESNNNIFKKILSENNTRGIYFTTNSSNNLIADSSFNYSTFNGISLYKSIGNTFTNVISSYNKESGFCTVDPNDSANAKKLVLDNNVEGETRLVSGSKIITSKN